MTIKSIVRELCKREGLKKQIDIAQMSEIVGHLSDMVYENFTKLDGIPSPSNTDWIDIVLYNNGAKRAKRKRGKK